MSGSSDGLAGTARGWPGIHLPTWPLHGASLGLLTHLWDHGTWIELLAWQLASPKHKSGSCQIFFYTWASRSQKVISVIPIVKVVPGPAQIQREEEETPHLLCGKVTWPGAFASGGIVIVLFGNLSCHFDAHQRNIPGLQT